MTSDTPDGVNPREQEGASTRLRLVSKPQVSGWKLIKQRLEQAVVRRETAVRDDPQHGQWSATKVGIGMMVVVALGAGVASFFSAKATITDQMKIVADSDTRAIYVHLDDGRLYPVLNLASARLIVGSPMVPVAVKSSAIANTPRGPLLGIPGAPSQMLPSTRTDSYWALCDQGDGRTADIDPSTGEVEPTDEGAIKSVAIGGPLTVGPVTAQPLSASSARLVGIDGQTWLIYREPSGMVVRAQIDMSDRAVVEALGLSSTTEAVPITRGLFNAITARDELSVPVIDRAGDDSDTVTIDGRRARVGSVVEATAVDGTRYYVVLSGGVQEVPRTVATMVRAKDSQGLDQIPKVTPDVVSGVPHLQALAVGHFPTGQVKLVDAKTQTVTCWSWSKDASSTSADIDVLVGGGVPLTERQSAAVVSLVTGASSAGRTVSHAYIPYESGRFVRVTGSDPANLTAESLWWVGDTGVRYGIDATSGGGDGTSKAVAALGVGNPVPAPWAVVKMFAAGPVLSEVDARVKHDGVRPDAQAGVLPTNKPEQN